MVGKHLAVSCMLHKDIRIPKLVKSSAANMTTISENGAEARRATAINLVVQIFDIVRFLRLTRKRDREDIYWLIYLGRRVRRPQIRSWPSADTLLEADEGHVRYIDKDIL